jgi:protein involved in polysaccharide export with SLBB domain
MGQLGLSLAPRSTLFRLASKAKVTIKKIMKLSSLLNASAVALLAFTVPVGSALAQQRPPANADSVRAVVERLSPAQQEILRRIRESGLSREQMRQRLRAAGYDPALADRYFDELAPVDTTTVSNRHSRITQPLPQPSGNFVEALRRIGILALGDSLPVERRLDKDSLLTAQRRNPEPRRSTDTQVFGRDLFAATTQFEAVTAGPVDPDYRFGPGDELTLLVTGDVEAAYDLQVTREGHIVVPDVGQVLVNGLTLSQVKARLNERLGRVYSGVQVGTTQVDLTVGRLRSKLVYVIGEVEVPGAYQVPGSATVFSALFRAGGPALSGSFRQVQIRRDNDVVRTVDLYDYLLKGDKAGDIRLEQGDVIFVPVVGSQVTVTGSVRRPAIYEIKGNESLVDAVAFAGGVEAQAAVERIQIDRILPPGQRQPGRERTLIDVALADLTQGRAISLIDGDRVRISTISDARRNRVAVTGDIHRPGEYEFRPGMTALDLIRAAQGLLPTAYTPIAHIVRLNPTDSTTAMIQVTLTDSSSTDYASRIVLNDLDELVVFSRARLANPRTIEIFGHVKNPGTYAFSDGMTIQDLVLLAGGFLEGADERQAEVARRAGLELRDSLAVIRRVQIDLGMQSASKSSKDADDVELEHGDQVFVRRLPGYQPLSTVEIVGEVVYPGPYTVESRKERISDLIKRAGGLTPEGYADGFRLFRDGKPVAVNFTKVLEKPGRADDLFIEPGDRMEIPRIDPTVLVTGAVQFESRVRYEKGLSVQDYLSRAGGVREDGNAGRVSVRYANGELRTPGRVLWVKSYPKVEPGSTITVPIKATATGFNWDQFLGRTMTVLSTLATVVLTIRALDN